MTEGQEQGPEEILCFLGCSKLLAQNSGIFITVWQPLSELIAFQDFCRVCIYEQGWENRSDEDSLDDLASPQA